jgi:hypothetical protein
MNREASMKTVFPASLLLVAVAMLVAPMRASAQCEPGAIFCAQVEIHGGVQWGAPPPPPPPAVVYVQPAPPPPVVVYRPAPPPPVVVYQPAPPPMVVYQEQPRQHYFLESDGTWGLHGHIGGTVSDSLYMGGGEVGIRWRPRPRFALDLGIGGYAGIDYEGNQRTEIPLTANFLFFFNPRSRLQAYALAGVGLSFAQVGGEGWGHHHDDDWDHDDWDDDDFDGEGMAYYGGMIGFGLEWRLSQHFALNTDLRGFLRHRFSGETNQPEFVEIGEDGRPTGRATDTSGGGLLTLGGTFYF